MAFQVTTAATPRLRLMIPALSAANFVVGLGTFVIVGLMLPINATHDLTLQQGGGLMTVFAVAFAILSPVLGAVTGRVDRRLLLCGALGLFALGAIGTALAPEYLTLCISRVIAAAGAAVITPVSALVASHHSPEHMKGRALAGVIIGVTLAQVAGVPAAVWLGHGLGWQAVFWGVAGLSLPIALALWLSVPEGLDFVRVGPQDLWRALRNGRQMLAVSFTIFYVGGLYIVYIYIAKLLEAEMGWGPDRLVLFLTMAGLGAVAGNIAGGLTIDRIGATRTLAGLCALQLLLLPVFSLLPIPMIGMAALAFAAASIGWAAGAAQQARLLSLGKQAGQVLISLNAGAGFVAAAYGASLGGLVISGFGPGWLGWAGAGSVLLAGALLGLSALWREKPA